MIRSVTRGLAALVVLLALFVGLPAALWTLGRRWLPDHLPSIDEVTATLGRPDDGSLFLGALVIIGSLAWACFAVSVLLELPAQLGWIRAIRVPTGMRWSQHLAGGLLAAVLSMTLAPAGIVAAAPAHADPPPTTVSVPAETTPASEATPAPRAAPTSAPAAATYTVGHHDTLWQIAETTLGDGMRYPEIAALNRGVPQADGGALSDGDVIREGWILTLPADARLPAAGTAASPAEAVTVQRGDTLSHIAVAEGLGSWQPIFTLNAGQPQPGGRVFDDPDLIFPGQVLDIPAASAVPPGPPTRSPVPAAPGPAPPAGAEGSDEDYSGPQDLPIEPPPAAAGSPPVQRPEAGSRASDTGGLVAESPGEGAPLGLAAALAGGGALLAAGMGAALLAQRRRRFRQRRPGRALAATPPALVRAETLVLAAARSGEADFTALDVALRSLAMVLSDDVAARLPDVVAARLSGDCLDLRLYAPAAAAPPAPWTVDDTGLWWSLDLPAESPVDPDRARLRLAPYPALVSVGDTGGQRWLLDLERVGAVRVSGPKQRSEDFCRHLAAELAVNSWSDAVYVSTCGFGAELVDLNPERLSVAEVDTAAAALHRKLRENLDAASAHQIGVLDGRMRAIAGDCWMPEVLMVTEPAAEASSGCLAALAAAVRGHAERLAVVVVAVEEPGAAAAPAGDSGWVLTLTADGQLLIPELELSLQARQLTAEQAGDVAALLAFERDAGDAPIPAATGDAPWQEYSDAAGALLEEVTLPRDGQPAEQNPATGPKAAAQVAWSAAVPGSVLPNATDTYVRSSAATAEDVQALARRAPDGLRERVEDDLEQLDRDLADWWSPDCQRSRLALLGPVTVRGLGDEATAAKSGHRRRYEELICYLASREHGATTDQIAADLLPAADDATTARSQVYRACNGARKWLGRDPETGEDCLRAGQRRPYLLRNVLVDAELFRQLRCRSGVRGRDGLSDLRAALELVSGPPFDQRTSGYNWLDGLDQTYTAMICDVAHLVVIAALTDGDTAAARAANEAGLRAAPEDEKILTDAVWIAFREGNSAEADSIVGRIVALNGGDDELDLDPPTAQAIHQARTEYLSRAS